MSSWGGCFVEIRNTPTQRFRRRHHRDDLELPGVQRALAEAVLATGTPVVLVLVTGRPYAIDWAISRCAAVVQAFFPGEEGSAAIAGVFMSTASITSSLTALRR